MKKYLLFFCLASLTIGATGQNYVIRNVNVIPMDREIVLVNQTVVVKGVS